ncbi:MAG: aminotransferase class I/II-fold pyridoxal phosphate-dependent enzyme [Hymenobacter sp.]|nr:aminotransferase class I/II-fold pyridoxal phosphate-dependent enzyme [Hymenobacter sp.]
MSSHLKRARRHYHQRRNVFCDLLRQHLGEWFSFQEPAGGMAVWGRFSDAVDLEKLSKQCARAGLGISDGLRYRTAAEVRPSHLRLGFAALNEAELAQSVQIMATTLRKMSKS